MTNGLFITIHGIDGTGKTSAAEHSAQLLRENGMDTLYYDRIPGQYTPEVITGDKTIDKKLAQSALIANYLGNDISITRDRWMIDVHADRAFKGDITQPSTDILVPDYSIVLTCRDDIRMQRIYERGNPTEEDLIPNREGMRAHFFEQYLLHNIGAFARHTAIIDTTNLSQDEVTEIIARTVL